MCHNEIRDITAEWLDHVCHNVVVEPLLQPLTGENVIPIGKMMLELKYMLVDSGVTSKVPFSM